MSKGEELGNLLDEGEVIQRQMNDIFIRNNIKFLDLKSLSKEGKEEWDKLLKQKDEITAQIGKLFK